MRGAIPPVTVRIADLMTESATGGVVRLCLACWVHRLVAVVMAVGSLVGLAACSSSAGSTAPIAQESAYALGECHAFGEPVGARGYEAVAHLVDDPMFVGADVGASAHLGDGRSIWLFGDTVRDVDGRRIVVRNSMILAGSECRALVVPPDGAAVIPDRADGIGYWPMSLVVSVAEGVSTVRVFTQRVRADGEGSAFVNLGPAIATFTIPDGGAPLFDGVSELGPDDESRSRVGWGAAASDGGDGYWYLYGTANPDDPLVFGWSVRVARTRIDDVTDPNRWEYWTGRDWSSRPGDAAEVISAVGGVSQTFSVFLDGDTWYAVSKLDGDLGTDLAFWPAEHPWGPFEAPVSVGRIPNVEEPSILRYMPLAHPEVLQASERSVVVSVSRNSADPQLLVDVPSLYRPFFVDIALPPEPSDALLDE